MPRYIKTIHPRIRSFAFLTPEEALKEFGGGFSLVGSPRPAQNHPPASPTPTPASKPKTKKRTK